VHGKQDSCALIGGGNLLIRKCIIAIALALLGSGCASTHVVSLGSNRWIAQAQSDLEGSYATIVLADGKSVEGTVVKLSPDSLWVSGEDSIASWAGSLRMVASIRQPPNYVAFGGGILGGALLGSVISKLVTVETKSAYAGAVEVVTGESGSGAMGAMYGGLFGGLIMAALTRVDEYRIIPPADQKK
jgi:hypothetical protein